MSRFSDQVRDEYGRPIPGVSIYVYKWDAIANVAGDLEILTDDSSAPLANPVISDDDGLYYFNSLDGQKLLEFHFGGKVQERDLILVGALPVPQASFGGLFVNAPALTIPVGMDLITTTGYSALDKGGAIYVADAAVDAAYVAANPRVAFISANGRGFRLSAEQTFTGTMFGIIGDGTTDDAAAAQTAFDWIPPGSTLVMPPKLKISSTVTYGNGTTTAISTKGNNCTIIWGSEPSNANVLIDTTDPWFSTAISGTQFVWGGAAGGTMFKVAGPIQGLRWIGSPTFNGGCVSNGAAGAGACFEARSFSSCTFDGIVVVNWQAGGRGALLTTVDSTGIGTVGANSVVSSGNRIGRIFAYSPYGHNGECAKIDGYQAANGEDVTVTEIGMVKCGISGTGAKGLVLGYCDDITIGKLVNTVYGTISGSPYGLYLAGTTTPFAAPARVYIYNAAVGQGLGVGGSTNAQVVVVNYEMDDAAILPTVTGLFIRNIIWTGHSTNMMAYPSDGKNKSSAVNNGDGYYGLDLSGTHFHSLTRQGSAAHVAANTDVEFEAGATGGPTTGVHFKVTTAGAGYPTGVGGAVTQLTSKATGVTLNKVCGAITMNAAALAANGIVSFPLTNSTIAADDDVRVWVKSGNASVGSYRVAAEGNGAGTRTIVVENKTAGSLSEAVVLGINVLKAVVA